VFPQPNLQPAKTALGAKWASGESSGTKKSCIEDINRIREVKQSSMPYLKSNILLLLRARRLYRGKGGKDATEMSSGAEGAIITNATTITAPVLRARVRQGEWSKAVVRVSYTDFPGQPTGAILEPGEEFKYSTTKKVNRPVERPDGVPVTYYELTDGRG